jgi:hypothetical protein
MESRLYDPKTQVREDLSHIEKLPVDWCDFNEYIAGVGRLLHGWGYLGSNPENIFHFFENPWNYKTTLKELKEYLEKELNA